MSLEKLPIPGPSEYLSAIGEVSYGFIADGGVEKAIRAHVELQDKDTRHKTDIFRKEIEKIVQFTAPEDRQLGITFDEHFSMGPAIMMGSIAGSMVVDIVHGGFVSLRDVLVNLPPPSYSITEDGAETRHNIAKSILELGDKGMRLIGDLAESEVEAWEEEVIKEVNNQRYFRSGFGMVILGAHMKHKNAKNEDFLKQVVTGQPNRNWDEQLKQLLGGSEPQ